MKAPFLFSSFVLYGVFLAPPAAAQGTTDIGGVDVEFEILPGGFIDTFSRQTGAFERFDASGQLTFRFLPTALPTGEFIAADLMLIDESGAPAPDDAMQIGDFLIERNFFSIGSQTYIVSPTPDFADVLTIGFDRDVLGLGLGFRSLAPRLGAQLTGADASPDREFAFASFFLSLRAVPEPGAGAMVLVGGLIGVLGRRRRGQPAPGPA